LRLSWSSKMPPGSWFPPQVRSNHSMWFYSDNPVTGCGRRAAAGPNDMGEVEGNVIGPELGPKLPTAGTTGRPL
jgi:hypothetical protein